MQMILVLSALVAMAIAAPAPQNFPDVFKPNQAKINRLENDNTIDGYKFGFETSDGTVRDEEGQLKNAGTQQEEFVVIGSYSWIGGDGKQYSVSYIADDFGFRPAGAHLPK